MALGSVRHEFHNPAPSKSPLELLPLSLNTYHPCCLEELVFGLFPFACFSQLQRHPIREPDHTEPSDHTAKSWEHTSVEGRGGIQGPGFNPHYREKVYTERPISEMMITERENQMINNTFNC